MERRRQIGAGRIDRRLNVARGAVDVAIYVELQNDARLSEAARGGHLRHMRDLAEPPLERRGDAGRHDLRPGAGELRRHHDRRKIDLRKRRDGQIEKGERAGQHDPDRDENRADRTHDEDGRKAHPEISSTAIAARERLAESRASRRSR